MDGKDTRGFILKEAQAIIDNYMRENKISRKPVRGKGFIIRAFKYKVRIGGFLSAALLLGILCLIFAILRFI